MSLRRTLTPLKPAYFQLRTHLRLPRCHRVRGAQAASPARRRSARDCQYGGPLAGVRGGRSVASPTPFAKRPASARSVTRESSFMRPRHRGHSSTSSFSVRIMSSAHGRYRLFGFHASSTSTAGLTGLLTGGVGTTRERSLLALPSTPAYRTVCSLGGGTLAASRQSRLSGSPPVGDHEACHLHRHCPVRPRLLQGDAYQPLLRLLEPLLRDRRAQHVAQEPLTPALVFRSRARRGMERKAVLPGAARTREDGGRARHGRERLPGSASAISDWCIRFDMRMRWSTRTTQSSPSRASTNSLFPTRAVSTGIQSSIRHPVDTISRPALSLEFAPWARNVARAASPSRASCVVD